MGEALKYGLITIAVVGQVAGIVFLKDKKV